MDNLFLLMVFLVLRNIFGQYGPDPKAVPADFMCAWRKLALNYSKAVRPDSEALVYDALELHKYCNDTFRPDDSKLPKLFPPHFEINIRATNIYVDSNTGSDSNPGTIKQPLKTITAAVAASRKAGKGSIILLRKGTFYLRSPIYLDSRDSGLTIQNYAGEEVWLSGGVLLEKLTWQSHQVDETTNIWKADVSQYNLDKVLALRVNGSRVSPARFPDANPETEFWPIGYLKSATGDWLPPKISPKPNPALIVNVSSPNREWDSYFNHYGGGIGGTCSIYDPPFSYWCQTKFSKGCGGCFTWNIPGGLNYKDSLKKNYTTWQDAHLVAWRKSHWANWRFELENYFPSNSTFIFGKGGFQGARGGPGSDWYISNVLEELDTTTEFDYNRKEKMLYYFANNTAGKPPSVMTQFVAVQNHILINATGNSQKNPIEQLSIRGLGFRDTAPTMMEPHGVPSGGDWALERTASLFCERTRDLNINTIKMTRIGGNGIMLSKYNMRPIVSKSHFEWMGGSAIAAWGYTDEITDKGIHGIDGTGGDFPRYAQIVSNLFREIGVWEKQSSAFFQAKGAESLIKHNVVFNLARAGINFNDGFGGGDNITENVLFNTCRESSDHGPINSWDRQPFLTTIRNGTATTEMAFRNVWRNIIIANYGGSKEVDNDDGSLFWKVYSNFMAYGWGQKFKCGAIYSYDNLKAFLALGGKFDAGCLLEDKNVLYPNLWHDDIMVHLGNSDFDYRQCWSTKDHDWDKTQVFNNTIYLQNLKLNAKLSKCDGGGKTLAQIQAQGDEPGSKQINSYPSTANIMAWAKDRLGQFQ